MPVYPRFRGRHKLHKFEDSGLEKCVGCSLCAAACPADCIRVVAAENTPEERVSAGERYAAVYEINMSRCIFCGYCEVACPFDAITMGHDFELSDYNRARPDLHEGDAPRRAARAHAAADRGRVAHTMSSVVFFIAAIGAIAGAIGVDRAAQPLLQRARARRPPAVARGAVPAAARGVHRRRAGRRLCRRGDGALPVRRLLHRRRGAAASGPAARACAASRRCSLLALFVELSIAVLGSGLKAIDGDGAPYVTRLRLAGGDRHRRC